MEPGDIACVILCGGEGKRMGSADRHKVCFPIAGTAAIVRTVGMLKSVGLKRLLPWPSAPNQYTKWTRFVVRVIYLSCWRKNRYMA